MRMGRKLLAFAGFTYAMFHAMLGLLWASEYKDSSAAYLSLGIYLALAISTMLLYSGLKLPLLQALLTVQGVLIIPPLAQSQLDVAHHSDYSTWYVMGIGTVLSALALRGHIVLAVVAMVGATFELMAWAGWHNFFGTGVLGAIMLLIGTSVVRLGLERAETETNRYAELNAQSVAQAAAQKAASVQRATMLQETLARTRPLLEAIAAGRNLDDAQRQEARLTEAGLRDEIRGRDLMSAVTRDAIYAARKRGVIVNVLDEGGLGALGAEQVAELHDRIARVLDSLDTGRVTVRSPRGEDWAVTVAAFDDGESTPRVWLRMDAQAQVAG